MNSNNEPGREIEALRGTDALSAAIPRIIASLDVDTVLARDRRIRPRPARRPLRRVTTIDGARRLKDAVLSGFTPDETQQVEQWSDGLWVFEAMRDVPSPLRVADMPAYIASLGLSPDGVMIKTFRGAPIRHRGVRVGTFFLGEKQTGPEFTAEDEEMLVLFSSQAANGRRRRPHPPRRAAGARRPGGRDRNLAGRCPGVRCPQRAPGVDQPRGAAPRRGPAHGGLERRPALAPLGPDPGRGRA